MGNSTQIEPIIMYLGKANAYLMRLPLGRYRNRSGVACGWPVLGLQCFVNTPRSVCVA